MNEEEYIEIPLERLSAELLTSIIEDFVLREGTDYGHEEYSLEQKVAQVREQLERRQAIVIFDPESETCTLVRR